MTIQAMIFDPADRVMHVAIGPGPATAGPPIRLPLHDLWD